jgi:hypothetical protein
VIVVIVVIVVIGVIVVFAGTRPVAHGAILSGAVEGPLGIRWPLACFRPPLRCAR